VYESKLKAMAGEDKKILSEEQSSQLAQLREFVGLSVGQV